MIRKPIHSELLTASLNKYIIHKYTLSLEPSISERKKKYMCCEVEFFNIFTSKYKVL